MFATAGFEETLAVGTNGFVTIWTCVGLATRLADDCLTLRAFGGTNVAAAFVAFLATYILVIFLATAGLA